MPAVRQEELGDSAHEEGLAMEKRPESEKHLITSDILIGLPDASLNSPQCVTVKSTVSFRWTAGPH
jgi:hypothetical protein